jgi:tyrosinase
LTVSVATGRRSVSKVPDNIPDTIPSIPEKLPAGGIAILPGMSEEKLLHLKAGWGDMYGDAETILIGDQRFALHGWEPFEVLANVTDGRPGGLNRNEISV